MDGKIAIEEHFAIAETAADSQRMSGDYWRALDAQLRDFADRRLAEMDRHNVAMAVLSLNSPAVQAFPDSVRAVEVARMANDRLATEVARRPDRFAGLAALPMQDPEQAARELERCVRDLGFKGALVNSFTQAATADRAVYYDAPQYLPFWAALEGLGVPFYLHPRDGLPDPRYEGHPWLVGSPWGFGEETGLHALRLMASGLFDRHPKLQIVLGHLGERIPYDIWRLDHRLKQRPDCPARRPLSHYLRENFHLTTSGHFCTPSLMMALSIVGADRVLFAVDYPFETHGDAAGWFDTTPIAESDRIKIGRTNAQRLFGFAG